VDEVPSPAGNGTHPCGPSPGEAGASSWSMRLAVATWLLGFCCTMGSRRPSALPADATQEYRQGYLATKAAFSAFPSLVALVAIGCGIYGLKRYTGRRNSAWGGILLAGTYLFLVWGVGMAITLHRRGYWSLGGH